MNASEIIRFSKKKNVLSNGGGHSMAGGFTLKEDSLEKSDYLLKLTFQVCS